MEREQDEKRGEGADEEDQVVPGLVESLLGFCTRVSFVSSIPKKVSLKSRMSPPNKEKVLPSRYWLGSCSRTRRTEERKYKPTISVQKRTREVVVSETCEPPETEEDGTQRVERPREEV